MKRCKRPGSYRTMVASTHLKSIGEAGPFHHEVNRKSLKTSSSHSQCLRLGELVFFWGQCLRLLVLGNVDT